MKIGTTVALAVVVALAGCKKAGCEKGGAVADAGPAPEPRAPDAAPPAQPWRLTGELQGTTATHAVLLRGDEILSVEIATGDATRPAVTAARDPVPSFERHLPRLGAAERDVQAVERLADNPIWVGGEAVVFMRGTDEVVTSLVGLDATTLEEAWTLEVAYRRPVRACATANGVLLVPGAPEPARFVNWLGQQVWLRELGDGAHEVLEFTCGDDRIVALTKAGTKRRLRTFGDATGDLLGDEEGGDAPPDSARRDRTDPRVRQDGDSVVGTP